MVASCAEKTYAATTISDVVSGASISRTTFYKRFEDKRACFDVALDRCLEEVEAVAVASISDADSPAEAVRKSSAAVLELLAARPALASLLAVEAVAVDPAVTGRYRSLVIPVLEALWDDGEERRAQMSPDLAFGRAQLLIVNQVASGRVERLPELQPELVYLALVPFAGHDEAVRQARLAVEDTATNRSLSLG
ncbi:MAG: TetR/AcrR family transcriptional regulator [Solirubrobacterales bacterium]